MEYSTQYNLSRADQIRWGRQLYLSLYLWRICMSFPLIALALLVTLASPVPSLRLLSLGFFSGVLFYFSVAFFKGYVKFRRVALDMHALVGDGSQYLGLSDTAVELRSSIGTRSVPWDKITRSRATRDFLTLFTGSIPVMGFPRSPLSAEAEEFVIRVAAGRASGG